MAFLKKFPSYDLLLKSILDTFLRFPLTILSAILATVVSIDLSDKGYIIEEATLMKLLTVFALGFPLFTSLQIFSESKAYKNSIRFLLYLAGIIILGLYYLSLPATIEHPYLHLNRFMLLLIAFHFLAAFIPFIGGNQINGFWQYNKTLFLRFLLAGLYSAVLYLGLTIALASADYLFGAEVKPVRYFQLLIVLSYLVQTFIFLSGIPKNLNELNSIDTYPKGLKIFTQYILMPLVILYFLILIAYEIKIIIQWNWPKGWVSELILWYAVTGILSFLLLHPLREKAGNLWIKKIINWFYFLLIPMIIMLFLAIFRRIADYGVTVNRYYVIALAIGLTIVVIYFIISKTKDIRLIPIVAFTITILSAVGPWSAFSVSESSQMNRLEHFLEKNELLTNSEIIPNTIEIPYDDRKEMSSIILYLVEYHGKDVFNSLLGDSVLTEIDTSTYYTAELIASKLGVEYISRWEFAGDPQYFGIEREQNTELDIRGFDHLVEFTINNSKPVVLDKDTLPSSKEDTLIFKNFKLLISIDNINNSIKFNPYKDSLSDEFLSYIDINQLIESQDTRQRTLPPDSLTFDISNEKYNARVIIDNLSGIKKNDSIKTNFASGSFMIKWK